MNKANQSNDGFINAQNSTNQETMTEAQRHQHYRELRKTWEENNSPAKKSGGSGNKKSPLYE